MGWGLKGHDTSRAVCEVVNKEVARGKVPKNIGALLVPT